MNRSQIYSHPELEYRAAVFSQKVIKAQHTTLLDLLEVYPERISWKPRLDHPSLLDYFRTEDALIKSKLQPMRIFFVEDFNFLTTTIVSENPHAEVNTTAYWLRKRFGVSPLFFNCLKPPRYVVKTGSGCFVRKDKQGRNIALDGLYRFSSGIDAPPAHVWFSHSLLIDQYSTYIIHKCPEKAKEIILSNAHERNIPLLLRPLAIDAFLSEDCLYEWGQEAYVPRNNLVAYENASAKFFIPEQMAEAVEKLHALSQVLHIIREDLTDFQERVEFILTVHRRLSSLLRPRRDHEDDEDRIDSVCESFDFMLSQATTLRRWIINYTERANIQINLFFNLSMQTDSRTNLDIAKLTSQISVATQRDSSSMITMAAVTMFFLPGTFVSALFSMVFFDSQPDDKGRPSLIVGSQWWFFLAITIPLTIVVFGTWILWQRRRNKIELENLDVQHLPGLTTVAGAGFGTGAPEKK